MHTLVDDLAGVVRSVAPEGEGAVIVGESFGGGLAMSFALAHSESVRALVLLNTFPAFLPRARLRLAIGGLTVMPWGAMGLVRHLTASRMHSPHTHRADIAYFLRQTRETTRTGYIGRLRILLEYDVRARLHDIRAPTLILVADRDRLVPAVAQGQYMAQRMPDATLRVLHGHGHICLIAPDLNLAEIIREWGGLERSVAG
jgi:pimeloyl-[acyl-carrier protein] methyl ester esterase